MLIKDGAPVHSAVVAHPLWQAMNPVAVSLPDELDEFAGLTPGEMLLVRPDRFVMTRLKAGTDALPQLDALMAALADEPARAAANG